jgi:hypothetical protein
MPDGAQKGQNPDRTVGTEAQVTKFTSRGEKRKGEKMVKTVLVPDFRE